MRANKRLIIIVSVFTFVKRFSVKHGLCGKIEIEFFRYTFKMKWLL